MPPFNLATLLEIRNRIRERTDNEHTQFVTDDELTGLVNTAYKELYGLLVRKSLQRVESTYSIPITGATSYGLPTDFYSLIGVFRTDGQTKTRLTRFSERVSPGTVNSSASQYRLVGANIVLFPNPTSGTYELVYIPVPGVLEDDDDELDGVLGWEELVVIDCSIRVLQKEESDVSTLKEDKAVMLRRIADEVEAVEFTEGQVVEDVRYGRRYQYDGERMEGSFLRARGVRGRWW